MDIYRQTWDTIRIQLVAKALAKWEALLELVNFDPNQSSFSIMYLETAKRDFVKFYARLEFWSTYCTNLYTWLPNSGKYYTEFINVYEGWASFFESLSPDDPINKSLRRLLNLKPPEGYEPHPNSAAAFDQLLDWGNLRSTSAVIEAILDEAAEQNMPIVHILPPSNSPNCADLFNNDKI